MEALTLVDLVEGGVVEVHLPCRSRGGCCCGGALTLVDLIEGAVVEVHLPL